MAGSVWAGEISILAPLESEMAIFSRNKVVNVVVKVTDPSDLDKLALKSERGNGHYDPAGRYVKDNIYYVHYRLPLKKGTNSFILAPISRRIKIKFTPLSSLLNVNFDKPGTYLFHRNETLPAVCAGCHNDKLPATAKIDRVRYGNFSPVCYSCHKTIAVGSEWRHFPSSALLCNSCHQADPGKQQITVPVGRVESLCFDCHVNENKWTSMSHIHGPVGTGDCTICHDPHGSANEFQLWANGQARLCVVCHEDKKKYLDSGQKRFKVHGILSARGCVACHSPHATDHRFQLFEEINDLCVSCHTGMQNVTEGHPVQKHPVKGKTDPLRAGFPLTCTSCHNPHGSQYDYLLIGDVRGGHVCLKCHDNSRNKKLKF